MLIICIVLLSCLAFDIRETLKLDVNTKNKRLRSNLVFIGGLRRPKDGNGLRREDYRYQPKSLVQSLNITVVILHACMNANRRRNELCF